jgi:predicted nucleic acid-binding protein
MNKESTRYLLDTNIFIIYSRGNAASECIENEFNLKSRPVTPLVCCVTVGEIYSFAQYNNWGVKKTSKAVNLTQNMNVIPLDLPSIYELYADIDTFSRRPGAGASARKMGKNDLWIAAVAKATNSILLTTDSDFDHLCPNLIRRIKICPRTGVVLDKP